MVKANKSNKQNNKLKVKTVRITKVKQVPVNNARRSYYAARLDPFDDAAVGARVPDEYSFPTDTRRVRALYRVVTGAAIGQLDLALTSNPIVGLVAPGTPSNVTISGPKPARTFGVMLNGSALTGTTIALPGAVESEVEAAFAAYRVVGYGFRIRSSANYTTVGGRITTITVPNTARMPRYQGSPTAMYEFPLSLNSTGAYAVPSAAEIDVECVRRLGLPPTGTGQISTNIVNFPTVKNGTMAELLSSGGAEMFGKTTSPHSKWFRSTDDSSGNFTYGAADSSVAGMAEDLTRSAGESDLLSMAGWTTLATQLRDLPANTSVEIEAVWHLEGITQGATLLPTSVSPFVEPGFMAAVDAQVANVSDSGPISRSFSSKLMGAAFPDAARLNKAGQLALTNGTLQNRVLMGVGGVVGNTLFPGGGGVVQRGLGAIMSMVPR